MLKTLLSLWICLLLLAPIPDSAATDALRTGKWLRMHVIAQNDTPMMQAVKYPVRDAVRSLYAQQAAPGLTMLENAQALLPQLTQAASQAAADAGYSGEVSVLLGTATFDQRTLDGLTVPAGDYPALIIRLGEGCGHNWWGLLDPERSLLAACAEEGDGLIWDWSPLGFFQALQHSLFRLRGGEAR